MNPAFQLSRLLFPALLALAACPPLAQAQDTRAAVEADSLTVTAPVKKEGFIKRVIRYFDDSNKPANDPEAFDISFIGGPYYSSETRFGIGIVASGNYCLGRQDSLTPRSVVALTAKVSTSGYFEVGTYGTNIFSGNRWRILYDVRFRYLPTYFWGIGYAQCDRDGERTKYNNVGWEARADFLCNFGGGFFAGPSLEFDLTDARGVHDAQLFEGLSRKITTFGPGITLAFDKRDNLTAPTRGVYVTLVQQFCPRFLGNTDHSYSSTEVTASTYHSVWRGGVVAGRARSRWAYGRVPWCAMSTFGGSHDMRGYYEGQYRDKFEADLTVELRQHVWRRNSVTVWADVGTIAPSPADVRWRHLLPGGGIGYRWEFKRHSNVRLDVGFGRRSDAIIFSINEAF